MFSFNNSFADITFLEMSVVIVAFLNNLFVVHYIVLLSGKESVMSPIYTNVEKSLPESFTQM